MINEKVLLERLNLIYMNLNSWSQQAATKVKRFKSPRYKAAKNYWEGVYYTTSNSRDLIGKEIDLILCDKIIIIEEAK